MKPFLKSMEGLRPPFKLTYIVWTAIHEVEKHE